MRTEAIAALVGRLERERDEAWREVRRLAWKRREDYDRAAREFELRTRQLQAMNDYLLGALSSLESLQPRPIYVTLPLQADTTAAPLANKSETGEEPT